MDKHNKAHDNKNRRTFHHSPTPLSPLCLQFQKKGTLLAQIIKQNGPSPYHNILNTDQESENTKTKGTHKVPRVVDHYMK